MLKKSGNWSSCSVEPPEIPSRRTEGPRAQQGEKHVEPPARQIYWASVAHKGLKNRLLVLFQECESTQ